jgi:hypothetical protein
MYQPVGIRYRVNVLYLSDPTRYAEQKRSELHAVVDRLVDGKQLVLGRMVSQFEESFATYIGTNHCISVASGTDAIEIALHHFVLGHWSNTGLLRHRSSNVVGLCWVNRGWGY